MKIAPIRSYDAYERALSRASKLVAKSDQKSIDELDVLQALVEQWERTKFQPPLIAPLEAIKFRMTQADLKPRDLIPYIGSRSRVSEVLSGTRDLSIDMIRALNKHLGIPASALIGSERAESSKHQKLPSKAALEKLRALGCMKPKELFEAFLARAFGNAAAGAMLRKSRTERTNAKTDFAAVEAWCAAVMLRAKTARVGDLAKSGALRKAGRDLAKLSVTPDGPLRVRDKLAELGIIFVVLEHLPGTFLDGAAMCRRDGAPIIALTLRYDRIDNFWFTLLHEFCHVAKHLKSGTTVILDDLELKGDAGIEAEADEFAQEALLPRKLCSNFKGLDFSPDDVASLASVAGVHPAIVAGRWQRDNNDYRRFSKLLGRGEVRQLFASQ